MVGGLDALTRPPGRALTSSFAVRRLDILTSFTYRIYSVEDLQRVSKFSENRYLYAVATLPPAVLELGVA